MTPTSRLHPSDLPTPTARASSRVVALTDADLPAWSSRVPVPGEAETLTAEPLDAEAQLPGGSPRHFYGLIAALTVVVVGAFLGSRALAGAHARELEWQAAGRQLATLEAQLASAAPAQVGEVWDNLTAAAARYDTLTPADRRSRAATTRRGEDGLRAVRRLDAALALPALLSFEEQLELVAQLSRIARDLGDTAPETRVTVARSVMRARQDVRSRLAAACQLAGNAPAGAARLAPVLARAEGLLHERAADWSPACVVIAGRTPAGATP